MVEAGGEGKVGRNGLTDRGQTGPPAWVEIKGPHQVEWHKRHHPPHGRSEPSEKRKKMSDLRKERGKGKGSPVSERSSLLLGERLGERVQHDKGSVLLPCRAQEVLREGRGRTRSRGDGSTLVR